jgi:uncharacterized ion transporter superfamily protein YfcC
MRNEYLRAFIIGSSFFVFFPFFLAVLQLRKKINYSYVSYSFIAPISLGLMNILSLYISNKCKFTKQNRFFLMSIFAPTCVIVFVYLIKLYNFNYKEWLQYIITIYVLYFIIWNFVIYYLDKNI